jgi:cbb3-type cytochrome oxidase subunit 3
METIDGIEIFPIISFLIFFTLFVAVLYYVIRKDKKSIEEVSLLPLDNSNPHSHEELK